MKSCELHFHVDEKDPVYSTLPSNLKNFTINLPPDYQFALRRNYTGYTPASDRYSQLATPNISSQLLDLSQHSPIEEGITLDTASLLFNIMVDPLLILHLFILRVFKFFSLLFKKIA